MKDKEKDLFLINIDELLKDGTRENKLGLKIAFTANPAIRTKGLYFSDKNVETKLFAFNNEKQIVAAPILIPNLPIARKEKDYEYDIIFDEEGVEKLAYFFNAQPLEIKYNDEHRNTKPVEAQILLSWIVNDPKTDRAYTLYGIDVPKGTWFGEVKVNDKDFWETEIKGNEKFGFSIEGWFETQLLLNSIDIKEKQKTKTMGKKLRLSAKPIKISEIKKAMKFTEIPTDQIMEIIYEGMEVGDKVSVLTIDNEMVEDFTGEVIATKDGVDTVIYIKDGIIAEKEAVEVEELKEETEVKAEEIEEEVKLEEVIVEKEEVKMEGLLAEDVRTILNEVLEPLMKDLFAKLGDIDAKLGTQLKSIEKNIELKVDENTKLTFAQKVEKFKNK